MEIVIRPAVLVGSLEAMEYLCGKGFDIFAYQELVERLYRSWFVAGTFCAASSLKDKDNSSPLSMPDECESPHNRSVQAMQQHATYLETLVKEKVDIICCFNKNLWWDPPYDIGSELLKAQTKVLLERISDIITAIERIKEEHAIEYQKNLLRAFYLMRSAKAVEVFSISLKELVSLLRSLHSGCDPPLELATRMLNSKFWVMEADIWADLLIVCCWANPTTIYCEDCGRYVEETTTSCNHVVCAVCVVGQGIAPISCTECGQVLTALLFPSALATGQRKSKRKRRLCQPATAATKRACTTSSGKSMSTRSRSKAAKQRRQVSTTPSTTVPRLVPKRSCSKDSQPKSLTTDNLSELLDVLYPALNKWYYLGLAMGLRHHILKAIKTEQRDDCLDCLREMLIKRLEMKELSREELIQSLQKPTVGLSDLAQTLEGSKKW